MIENNLQLILSTIQKLRATLAVAPVLGRFNQNNTLPQMRKLFLMRACTLIVHIVT